MTFDIPDILRDAITAATGEDGALDKERLAGMASDPLLAEAIVSVQSQCSQAIDDTVDKVAKALMQGVKADEGDAAAKSGAGFSSLAAMSQRRAQEAKQHRELAQALVIGALLNHDNPDWDPFDPATHRPAQNSPLLTLLQLELS